MCWEVNASKNLTVDLQVWLRFFAELISPVCSVTFSVIHMEDPF